MYIVAASGETKGQMGEEEEIQCRKMVTPVFVWFVYMECVCKREQE